MPVVEACLVAPPAAPKNAIGRDRKNFSDSPATKDNFASVMQATLATHPQKAAGKNPANGKTSPFPANAPAVPGEDSATEAESTGKSIDRQKGNPAGTGSPAPASTNTPTPDPMDTLAPTFLSLPLFLSITAEPTIVSPEGQKTGGEKIQAVAGPAGEAEKTESPAGRADQDGREKNSPAIAPATTNTNSPDKSFSPLKAADLPLQKEVAPVRKDATPLSKDAAALTNIGAPRLEAIKSQAADESAKTIGEPAAGTDSTSSNPTTVTPTVRASDFAAESAPAKAVEIGGTGVAITELPMKNLQKTNKIAGPDVKVLPVGEEGAAREKNLPTSLLVTPARPTENPGANLNFSFANGHNPATAADSPTGSSMVDLPSLTDTRLRVLERTNDMMTLHAMRLVESKSDALSVILKPSVGTELSLELRQHPDGVEARATLTRGDHQFLSQHWPELQQRLELRGIKLAPLGGETDFLAGNNGQFQPSHASEEEAAEQASAFAEFASVGNAGGAGARLALVHDGWESWA